MVEGNHKTGMPALIRSVPNRDAHKRGTEPVFVVVVLLLNGTAPLQSSGLNTQVVSTGLSTEALEGP
jgi:hypothetical protein